MQPCSASTSARRSFTSLASIPPTHLSDQNFATMDWAPTFLAATDTPSEGASWDGVNLLEQLIGEAPPIERKLFWRYKSHSQAAAKDGRWKYLKIGGKEHLFDIQADPRERLDLKNEYSEIFQKLKSDFDAWNAEMIAYPSDSFSEDVRVKYTDRY